MKFTLTIKCDNASFADESALDDDRDDTAAQGQEVARILRKLADEVRHGVGPNDPISLHDANGNTVGTAQFED